MPSSIVSAELNFCAQDSSYTTLALDHSDEHPSQWPQCVGPSISASSRNMTAVQEKTTDLGRVQCLRVGGLLFSTYIYSH